MRLRGLSVPSATTRRDGSGRSRGWWLAAAIALIAAVLPVSGAVANHTPNSYTNRSVTITPGTSPQDWMGVASPGANAFYDFDAGEPCYDPAAVPPDPGLEYCDITLLHVDVAPSFWDTTFGGVRVTVGVNAQDYDLQVFESDAGATRWSSASHLSQCSHWSQQHQPGMVRMPSWSARS